MARRGAKNARCAARCASVGVVGRAWRLSLSVVRCGLAFALPLRVCRDGRIFCPCGAVGSSGVCLLVRYAFRAFCGVFGGLCALLGSFARLPSLSNAPQWAKFRACCVFCPRCVFSVGLAPLPRLWAEFEPLAVACRSSLAPWVLPLGLFRRDPSAIRGEGNAPLVPSVTVRRRTPPLLF